MTLQKSNWKYKQEIREEEELTREKRGEREKERKVFAVLGMATSQKHHQEMTVSFPGS